MFNSKLRSDLKNLQDKYAQLEKAFIQVNEERNKQILNIVESLRELDSKISISRL